ncbi:MAG: CapA family protein, partial [bacterium]
GEFGVRTIGAGRNLAEAIRPVILEEAGGIGLFSVGYRRGCKPAGEETPGCFLWNEMELIQQTILKIKERCRWCIIVAHGGEEFTALPSPYTRERYLKYLEMGADLIVGHHPHVPMNYELVGEKAIFYSLGNFIFDTDYQRAQYHTEDGIVLTLTLTEEDWSFQANGILIDRMKERLVSSKLPKIFVNVSEEEYELLSPLSTQMFIEATKRQQRFLYPEKFRDCTEEAWEEHFMNPKRSGRVVGEGLDFQILLPLAKEAEKGAWKQSTLTDVKDYILEQMKPKEGKEEAR